MAHISVLQSLGVSANGERVRSVPGIGVNQGNSAVQGWGSGKCIKWSWKKMSWMARDKARSTCLKAVPRISWKAGG